MSRTLRRVLVVVAVAAALLACSARAAECDVQCSACAVGLCANCNAGYYLDGQTCKTCPVANCATCDPLGVCITCADGYTFTHSEGTGTSTSISAQGVCTANSNNACGVAHCSVCVASLCVTCESGYYIDNRTCTACPTPHCADCQVTGHCFSCQDGYKLNYLVNTSSGVNISDFGECNGASFTSALRAAALLVVVAAAAVFA